MALPTYTVNLDLPPEERWLFLKDARETINELLEMYLRDLVDNELLQQGIAQYRSSLVAPDYLKELEGLSHCCDFTAEQLLMANLYYDLLKFYWGCTAFSVHNGEQMLHARNLDWFTENNALSLHSCIFLFQRQGETVFKTVGWPGFIGVLSGNRPGAFTITLNAVSSNEPPEINPPVSFLLRDVLDQESHFEGARQCLANAPIACDCLLLLSGTEAHEKVVIERTPSRHAIRESQEAFIVVTNDYKVLEYRRSEEELLASTSCQRFDQACLRLFDGLPKTLEDCVTILQDAAIQMEITVQQMAFENASGRHLALKNLSR